MPSLLRRRELMSKTHQGSQYTLVDKIQASSTTAYISTFNLFSTIKLRVEFQFDDEEAIGYALGSGTPNRFNLQSNALSLCVKAFANSTALGYSYTDPLHLIGGGRSLTTIELGVNDNNKLYVTEIGQSSVATSSTSYTNGIYTPSPSVPICFGAMTTNSGAGVSPGFMGKLGEIWAYDTTDGSLKHNLKPVIRNSDSTVGYYDTVTDTFYSPTGGTFIYGSIIGPL